MNVGVASSSSDVSSFGSSTSVSSNTSNPSGNTSNPSGNTSNPSGNTSNPSGNTSNSSGISAQVSVSVVPSSSAGSTNSRFSNSSIPSMPISALSSPIQQSVPQPIQTSPPARSRPDSLPTVPESVPSDSAPTVPVQVSSETQPSVSRPLQTSQPARSRPDSLPTVPESIPGDSAPTVPVQVSSKTNVTTSLSPPMASSPPSLPVSSPAPDDPTVSPPPNHPADPDLPSSVSSSVSKTAAPPPSGSNPASNAVKSSGVVNPSSNVVKSSGTPQGPTTKAAAASPTGQATSPAPASPTGHATSPAPSSPAVHDSPVSFTGTTTSTITDAPESTLAKPSFISFVDSNGKTSFTAPPLVTILSTSKEANGSFVTFTHVVANPTGFSQAISGGRASFFQNAGVVAGVFLVIGVILTAIVASGTFILCRRRRRRREAHRRWLISINRPRPMSDGGDGSPDPFQDPRSAPSPPMRVVPHVWDTPTAWDTQARATHRISSTSDLGLFNVPPISHSEVVEEQRQGHHDSNEIGLAITTNHSQPSLAQSSPSIYPPSLPAANDDHDRVFEGAYSHPHRYRDASPPPPPRPRRSHLRDTPSKGLLTPPSSVSDHSPVSEVAATSPWGFTSTDRELSTIQLHGSSQLNEIMGRKTLLDVRPRSQDSVKTVRRESD